MKKNMTIAVMVVSLVFASLVFVNATASNVLRVNVPFTFQVGKTTMPAGTYVVEIQRTSSASALGTMVVIRTLDGKTRQLFGSQPANASSNRASLTFNKYADTYFLSSVDSFDLGCKLYKSPSEKEMASKANAHQTVAVTAE